MFPITKMLLNMCDIRYIHSDISYLKQNFCVKPENFPTTHPVVITNM